MSDTHHQSFISKYVFSTDHKMIGLQYLITGILMALVGGYFAYAFRMQLAFPGQEIPFYGAMTAGEYNKAITMHGSIMIFWVAMPILVAAFGNLLIPLMVGADDMAFPTLNMMSYWTFVVSIIILLSSFFVSGGVFDGGWTAYPPLSAGGYKGNPGWGGTLWLIAVAVEFAAFLMGGINFIVTTFNMRVKGLTWTRMPMFLWMSLTAVFLFMFSVGPLIAGAIMLIFDRTMGTGFFNPAAGGDPLLFQHMFWFFGHPEVYVLLLPALGIIAEVMTALSRKPLFAYKAILYAIIAAGVLSFIVWAHHQFISGINPRMANFFSLTTLIISVPFAVVMFAFMATLWKGVIDYKTPMLFALGFIVVFLIGGVTGVFLGASGFDIYAHDTYFVIAHFHYALIPTVLFGGLAGVYFWYPKFIGRMYNETLGKIHFWMMFVAFNGIFMPLFFEGLAGSHRRIFDYSAWPSLMTPEVVNYRVFATYSLLIFICAQVVFLYNMIVSAFKGKKAEANPWKANSLEWAAASPPPHGNFTEKITVYRGPYEYSNPQFETDYKPQHIQ